MSTPGNVQTTEKSVVKVVFLAPERFKIMPDTFHLPVSNRCILRHSIYTAYEPTENRVTAWRSVRLCDSESVEYLFCNHSVTAQQWHQKTVKEGKGCVTYCISILVQIKGKGLTLYLPCPCLTFEHSIPPRYILWRHHSTWPTPPVTHSPRFFFLTFSLCIFNSTSLIFNIPFCSGTGLWFGVYVYFYIYFFFIPFPWRKSVAFNDNSNNTKIMAFPCDVSFK